MSTYINQGRLKVAKPLHEFIEKRALPGLELSSSQFWSGFESVLLAFSGRNNALLEVRTQMQTAIDEFHIHNKDADFAQYKGFLESIDYLKPSSESVQASTQNVDEEVAHMAGPQLVVPINNARYALNAVNARWGSFYDALYGTDIIDTSGELSKQGSYNPKRGAQVIKHARRYLDFIAPLREGSHANSARYFIEREREEGIEAKDAKLKLCVLMDDGSKTQLATAAQFCGFTGDITAPTSILLKHHGLHVDILIDDKHPIGKSDPAHIKDIAVEAALSTIMDCEDSVAAVDAEDKTLVYENWLGLMQGNLEVNIAKGEKQITRKMQSDRCYQRVKADGTHNGSTVTLSGRSLMFVRNVGHLMQNDAVLLDGEPVYEGIMDGVMTSLIALHDLKGNSPFKNSKAGSVYIVKPKMHGPEEVAFTNELFGAIESALGMPRNTLKVGIMDEERRTSLHLKECIGAASERVVFINTGFLDRTGDEIHTSMMAGPFAPKGDLKARPWLAAYESANVLTGLQCGLSGRAQIGKGMWPIPDQMKNMMSAKIAHPESGATTAWVPSPTAATLHALHYHLVDVFSVQQTLKSNTADIQATQDAYLDNILNIPLLEKDKHLSAQEIQQELDNNVQGILGYVVRWVHQGIGCSKVPDIHNIGLMEDRATLRISSQHIANWLEHGLLSAQQVNESLQRMAALVDKQNESDPDYIPMLPDLDSCIGFQAAKDLIFLGKVQTNGYTEPLLHERRRQMKEYLKAQKN